MEHLDKCVDGLLPGRGVADGIAVGTAEVFDRLGPLGTATVTCLANARRTIDFSESRDDGTVDPTGA